MMENIWHVSGSPISYRLSGGTYLLLFEISGCFYTYPSLSGIVMMGNIWHVSGSPISYHSSGGTYLLLFEITP